MVFGLSEPEWEEALPPKEADAVIIGGGIAGTATAYFLAKAGMSVVLCEKGRIAGEQSSRNWGYIRQQGRDSREVPAIKKSLEIWRGLEAELGADLGWRQAGVFYLTNDEAELSEYENWVALASDHDIESLILSGAELDRHLSERPGSNSAAWRYGLFTPSDGRAEPFKAVPALAKGFEKLGGRVLTSCAVRGLETGGGKVIGVVTERGAIRTSRVVCAAGIWSSLFCANAGIDLPQLKIKSSVGRTGVVDPVPEAAVWTEHFAIRRRQDGGCTVAPGSRIDFELNIDAIRFLRPFWGAAKQNLSHLRVRLGKRAWREAMTPRRWALDAVSPFEKERVVNPEPNHAFLDAALRAAGDHFPGLKGQNFQQRWAGLIDVTPDAVPVLGPLDGPEGLFVATGLSGHGFGLGPGAGQLMAELLIDGNPSCDLQPFRHSRFFDGSDLTPQQGL